MSEEKKPIGRPTKYTDELRDEICSRLADGQTLRQICANPDMPNRRTISRWVYENIGEEKIDDVVEVEGFCPHYTRARDLGLDVRADELLHVGEEGYLTAKDPDTGEDVKLLSKEAVALAKLRAENYKWYLSKMAPRKYGTNKTVNHQQLDEKGEKTDPAKPVVNVYAQEIMDRVNKQMEKLIEAENNDSTST